MKPIPRMIETYAKAVTQKQTNLTRRYNKELREKCKWILTREQICKKLGTSLWRNRVDKIKIVTLKN